MILRQTGVLSEVSLGQAVEVVVLSDEVEEVEVVFVSVLVEVFAFVPERLLLVLLGLLGLDGLLGVSDELPY